MSPRSGMDIKSELQNFRQRIMNQELGPYDISAGVPIFLKEPFSAVIIPQISEIFDTRLIYVLRPFAEIEATRVRRAWGFTFSGARVIYSHMFFDLVNYRIPTLIVRFPDLIASPVEQVMKIAEFSGLKANPTTILAASNFIATHRLTYGQGNGRTAVA